MADNEKLVRLKPTGPKPEVEMIIGQAQWGKYVIDLWDSEGTKFETVGSGLNVDQIPDKFTIPHLPKKLQRRMLSWEVKIAAFSKQPGQLYSVTVRITQAGKVCPGGLIQDSGPLDKAEYVYDFVRFTTA